MRHLLLVGLFACARHSAPLAPAGAERDEGHGELAKMSQKLLVDTTDDATGDPFNDNDARGDGSVGGSTYGSYNPPSWIDLAFHRDPKHHEVENLEGVVEGTVTWRSPLPAPLKTACGTLPPQVRAAAPGRPVGGVIVYIERVAEGRILPIDIRPSTVGGSVSKRGCAFLPAAQIVTPLPAPLAVHGDATPVQIRIGANQPTPLQEGGRVAITAPVGVTRIDAADGTHASAWVLGLETPVYAITDDRGRFRLDEVAAGTHDVTFWHPPIATVTNGSLTYGAPIVVKRRIRVPARGAPVRLDATIAR